MFLWASVLPKASLLPNISAYPTALGTESGSGEEGVVLSARVWAQASPPSTTQAGEQGTGHFGAPIRVPW